MHTLKEEGSPLKVLVVSMYPEDQYAMRALRAGAFGYVNKGGDPQVIVQAVRTVEYPFTPGAQEAAVAIEDDHRVRTAIEHVDIVVAIDADRTHVAVPPAGGQLPPALGNLIAKRAFTQNDAHALAPTLACVYRARLNSLGSASVTHGKNATSSRPTHSVRK